jgi:hypothetical protein
MALFAANALAGHAVLTALKATAKPAKRVTWRSGILQSSTDFLLVKPLTFLRNVLQGALAGIMTFFGAMQFAGASSAEAGAVSADATASLAGLPPEVSASISSFLSGIPSGGGSAAVAIIGAAVLFMSAGRGVARILGLMAFIAVATLYANGANPEDFTPFLTSVYESIKDAIPALASI